VPAEQVEKIVTEERIEYALGDPERLDRFDRHVAESCSSDA
jgi:hypothetical protein